MNNSKPFGNNIRFQPKSKDKIIGDTSRYYLYGTVLAVGDDVKHIEVGDTVEFTQWALNKTLLENGEERFYIQEHPDFILNVWKK